MAIPLTGKFAPSAGERAFKLYDAKDIQDNVKILVFSFPAEDLAAGVLLPRPSWPLLSWLDDPTSTTDQRLTIHAGTVGSGANSDLLLETDDNLAFTSPTVQATLALDALSTISTVTFTASWVWDVSAEYLRLRCSLMDAGTAPKDVTAFFEWR